jgi:hypothetical protein
VEDNSTLVLGKKENKEMSGRENDPETTEMHTEAVSVSVVSELPPGP